MWLCGNKLFQLVSADKKKYEYLSLEGRQKLRTLKLRLGNSGLLSEPIWCYDSKLPMKTVYHWGSSLRHLEIYCLNTTTAVIITVTFIFHCPIGWDCRIHRLLFCTAVPPLLNDTKRSDDEALVMLELWGMQSTQSLPNLPGTLWPVVVAHEWAYLWVK